MFDKIDPLVKVSVLSDAKPVSAVTTSTKQDEENPSWDEVVIVDLPVRKRGEVGHKEIVHVQLEIEETDAGIWTSLARAGPFTVEQVQEFIALEKDVSLELHEVARHMLHLYQHDFSSSKLTVRFETPQFERAQDRLRGLWIKQIEESGRAPDGSIAEPSGSGLSCVNTAMPFLEAMKSLENAMYFFEIIVVKCGAIAERMGDLGVVLMAQTLKPLLIEARDRVTQSCADQERLSDAIYKSFVNIAIEHDTSRDKEQDRAITEADKAKDQVSLLKTRILDTIDELLVALGKYKNVEGVLEEVAALVNSLTSKLQSEETSSRTDRFGACSP